MDPADPQQIAPTAHDPGGLAPPEGAVTVLVDADACPVKDEIYRVAERHGAHVRVVSNQMFRVPVSARAKRVVVYDPGSHDEPQGRTPAGRLGREPSWAYAQRPAPEGPKYDAADDWIAEHASARTLVVTGDILLADRALKAGATVLAHTGKPFDAGSIGGAVATRAIMADLRAGMDGVLGGSGGGPAPFRKENRSLFLRALDRELVRLGRVRSVFSSRLLETRRGNHLGLQGVEPEIGGA